MSSGSGPGRFDEKGTLKDRLTWVPGGIAGGALVAVAGRFIGGVTGMSWLVLENGKPADGVIFSQPCRAWPVKFDILCIGWSARAPWGDGGRAVMARGGGRGERNESRRRSESNGSSTSSSHGASSEQGDPAGVSIGRLVGDSVLRAPAHTPCPVHTTHLQPARHALSGFSISPSPTPAQKQPALLRDLVMAHCYFESPSPPTQTQIQTHRHLPPTHHCLGQSALRPPKSSAVSHPRRLALDGFTAAASASTPVDQGRACWDLLKRCNPGTAALAIANGA